MFPVCVDTLQTSYKLTMTGGQMNRQKKRLMGAQVLLCPKMTLAQFQYLGQDIQQTLWLSKNNC